MLSPSFNKNVKRIIQKLAFPAYVIILDPLLKCPCRDQHETADPACKKCLGTGKKIKIRKIKAAMEPDEVSVRLSGQQQKIASNYYYFDADDVTTEMIQPGNIIVRDDEADILQSPKKYRSDSNKVIYYHCEAVNKKDNKELFLENFRRLVQ